MQFQYDIRPTNLKNFFLKKKLVIKKIIGKQEAIPNDFLSELQLMRLWLVSCTAALCRHHA